jgi:hypothetical protein
MYLNKVVLRLPYKILIHYNCTYCLKATDEKDGAGNFLDTVKYTKIKKLLRNKIKAFLRHSGPLSLE